MSFHDKKLGYDGVKHELKVIIFQWFEDFGFSETTMQMFQIN